MPEFLGYVPEATCSLCGAVGDMQPWGEGDALVCIDCVWGDDFRAAKALAEAIDRDVAARAKRRTAATREDS